jgi:hypothetical protein
MGTEVPAQIRGLRHRTHDPVAGDFSLQVLRKNVADPPVRGCRWEAGERDAVPRPSVTREYPQGILVVMKLHPRQTALEPKPFCGVEFHGRGQLFIGELGENPFRRACSCAGGCSSPFSSRHKK